MNNYLLIVFAVSTVFSLWVIRVAAIAIVDYTGVLGGLISLLLVFISAYLLADHL
jgi:hypothetical protein